MSFFTHSRAYESASKPLDPADDCQRRDLSPIDHVKPLGFMAECGVGAHETTTLTPIQSRLFIFLASLILVVNAVCQERTASDKSAKDLPFRVLNVRSIGSSLWLCGTDESVAVSSRRWRTLASQTHDNRAAPCC